jgi:hypothetical protein
VATRQYQYLNPTSQVSLSSRCYRFCQTTSSMIINWQIFAGSLTVNTTSAGVVTWQLFNQTESYRDRYFFGASSYLRDETGAAWRERETETRSILGLNRSDLTVTKELFLNHAYVKFWRFQVTYGSSSSSTDASSSSMDFQINAPPSNGSCSISPTNGTTTTLFTVQCRQWRDSDGIQDYAIYSQFLFLSLLLY